MKKLSVFMVLFLIFAFQVHATDAVYNVNRGYDIVGWHVFAADDDCSTAGASLVTDEDTAYAQLSAEDEVEILSSDALDITQTVTIYGINSAGKKSSESIALNTADGTTVVAGTTIFRYVDYVEIDKECAGAITIQKQSDNVDITVIPIGSLSSQISQHFNGEKTTYLTGWSAGVNTTTANMTFTLRFFPDDADALDSSDGFKILDTIFIDAAVTSPYNVSRSFPQPIKLSAGGWIAIFADGSADNGDAYITMQGYDTR